MFPREKGMKPWTMMKSTHAAIFDTLLHRYYCVIADPQHNIMPLIGHDKLKSTEMYSFSKSPQSKIPGKNELPWNVNLKCSYSARTRTSWFKKTFLKIRKFTYVLDCYNQKLTISQTCRWISVIFNYVWGLLYPGSGTQPPGNETLAPVNEIL